MEPWRNDCVAVFLYYFLVMLRNDVLIENNKYGYNIMQNNGTMKAVHLTHAQMAETRHSFRHP